MSLVGKEILEFSADAYHNGEFITVTSEDIKGKWAIFCFYPADFSFVCPTELGDLQDQYASLKSLGVKSTQFLQILTLFIKHGMMTLKLLEKLSIQ